MKTVAALVIALCSLSALAGEITLLNEKQYPYTNTTCFRQEFGINKDLGRAWVNLAFTEPGNESSFADDTRVQVSGLSFNTTTNQVLLDVDGTQIVCADVKVKKFSNIIKPTGKCTFAQKYNTVEVDNGFEIEKVQKLKITLNY